MALLLLLNLAVPSTLKLLTWKSVSLHSRRQTWHPSALFLEYKTANLTTHFITGGGRVGVGQEWNISGGRGGDCQIHKAGHLDSHHWHTAIVATLACTL